MSSVLERQAAEPSNPRRMRTDVLNRMQRMDGNLYLSGISVQGIWMRLITNFHLPESTLIMLVSALAGKEHVLAGV